MSRYVYVYVGERADDNLQIGLRRGIWGWKNPYYGPDAKRAAAELEKLEEDTYLVFAEVTPPSPRPRGWPRTGVDDLAPWRRAPLRSLIMGRVADPMFQATDTVWPDDVYPYRVRLRTLADERTTLAGSDLSGGALEAICRSAHTRGTAILGPAPFGESDGPAVDEPVDLVPDHLLPGTEDLNGRALTLVRREQSKLRAAALGSSTVARCYLCRRELPTSLLRLAHIKRRSACSPVECRNRQNTMLACALGCDELFEHGFISVLEGRIVAGLDDGGWTDGVRSAVGDLVGASIVGYTPEQEPFFAWHRADHHLLDPPSRPSTVRIRER